MEDFMRNVRTLSSQDSHDKALEALIADENIDWEKKASLKRQMETDHNQTLRENAQTVAWAQAAQTQSVHAATSSWTLNYGMLLTCGVLVAGLFSPKSRKLIRSTTKHLNSPAGKRALRNLNRNLQGAVIQHAPSEYITAGQTAAQ